VDDLDWILGTHAVSGVFPAEDVLELIPGFGANNTLAVTTVNVETIFLGRQAFAPDSVFVGPTIVGNGPATVVAADIEACNGIVHVIDKCSGGPAGTTAESARAQTRSSARPSPRSSAGVSPQPQAPARQPTSFWSPDIFLVTSTTTPGAP